MTQLAEFSEILRFNGIVDSVLLTSLLDTQLILIGKKWLRFKCPCGCGQQISINLMHSYSPKWTAVIKDEKLSLDHSIRLEVGCKSHFSIIDNKVIWEKG